MNYEDTQRNEKLSNNLVDLVEIAYYYHYHHPLLTINPYFISFFLLYVNHPILTNGGSPLSLSLSPPYKLFFPFFLLTKFVNPPLRPMQPTPRHATFFYLLSLYFLISNPPPKKKNKIK